MQRAFESDKSQVVIRKNQVFIGKLSVMFLLVFYWSIAGFYAGLRIECSGFSGRTIYGRFGMGRYPVNFCKVKARCDIFPFQEISGAFPVFSTSVTPDIT